MPIKHDQFSTASRKALALFGILLFSKHPYSLKQLAVRLECSRQTILRLMDEIERTNAIKIRKWKDGKENFYQAQTPKIRPNVALTEDELAQLMLCRDFTAHILPKEQRKLLLAATDKASCFTENTPDALPTAGGDSALPLGQGVVKGGIDYSKHEKTLDALIAARNSHQVLDIEYLARVRTDSKIHAFVPVRLVAFHDGLYVRGWRVSDKGAVDIISPMTLALHRIQKLWKTRRVLPPALLKTHTFPSENASFGMANDGAVFEVVVQFFPPATAYIRERQWGSRQTIAEHSDASLTLNFEAQSELEVVKWVLSFGQEARLLKPEYIRERIAMELHNALSLYPQTT